MSDENAVVVDENQVVRQYICAALSGLTTNVVQHNMSADQMAERAIEIGKKLAAWDKNNFERPQERRGGR